jgi:hypothetical protein
VRGTQPLDQCWQRRWPPWMCPSLLVVASVLQAVSSSCSAWARRLSAPVPASSLPMKPTRIQTYVDALIAASASDTVLTDVFATGWPDAPHRVLRCSLEAAEAFTGEVVATVGERNPAALCPRTTHKHGSRRPSSDAHVRRHVRQRRASHHARSRNRRRAHNQA